MKWGESFWLESEYRIKEITTTLEKDMGASAEAKLKSMIPGFKNLESSLDARVAKKLTEEQKAEIVRLTQPVVDKVQIKTLTEIMNILNEILDDDQKRYFITIDNAKIIIALRIDLLDRVFRYTRSKSPGYQEEKYQSMYLKLTWEEKELREVLDKRVNILVREQYTKAPVNFNSLMPSKVKKENPSSFFFGRTLNTPRDAIRFFNLCIKHAEGKAKFNQTILLNAEKEYSSYRIGSLADEWIADYPNLIKLAFFLESFPSIFIPEEMKADIELKMAEFLISNPQQDYIYNLIDNKFNNNEIFDFLREMINILFKVGIIGIRPDNSDRFIWSFKGNVIDKATIRISRRVKIHPAFFSTLGVR